MAVAEPYVREAGSGPAVVCVHANATSSVQWHPLMALLSERYHVFAPDSYGAGRSCDWPSDRRIQLRDEVDLLEPVLAAASPCTMVGHSYGGAVALIAALSAPHRIRGLVLFEPTLFALVDQSQPSPNGVEGIREAAAAAAAALDARHPSDAAKHFLDYWMGTGTWASMPAERKPAIEDSIRNVRRWAHALFTEPTPVDAFAALQMPVLYMLGARSPESAHAVADVLIPVLSHVRVVEFDGLGHMGPVTHPDLVNAEIARFLEETPGRAS
jgi:pimeloyl-ACP methyl ester carboxylesterase